MLDRATVSAVGFKAWVDQQPKGKRYDYSDPMNCAFAQYLQSLGDTDASVGSEIYTIWGTDYDIPDGVNAAVFDYNNSPHRSFAELSERLAKVV